MSRYTYRSLASLTKDQPDAGRAIVGETFADRNQVQELYTRHMDHLRRFDFWNAGEDGTEKPPDGLWAPQRKAVGLVHAYLASEPYLLTEAGKKEGALIKMPTGTGKTGVIATIACASPKAERVLILTPRVALVRQMLHDLTWRFWRRFNVLYFNGEMHIGMEEEEFECKRNELKEQKGIDGSSIFPLRASYYERIIAATAPRQILIGTFNALHGILGIEPPAHRSMSGRSTKVPAQSLKSLTFDEEDFHFKGPDVFIERLKKLDLVIVDEGHYEPAYSWSQCLKTLDVPAVIMTATPYRNDYKYFSVLGNFVFNLSWQQAVRMKLIRDVEVASPAPSPPLPKSEWMPSFAKSVKEWLGELTEGQKAIIALGTSSTIINCSALCRYLNQRTSFVR